MREIESHGQVAPLALKEGAALHSVLEHALGLCPPELVRMSLAGVGIRSRRSALPPEVLVHALLAAHCVPTPTIQSLVQRSPSYRPPLWFKAAHSSGAIYQARSRLGEQGMRAVARQVIQPLSPPEDGSLHRLLLRRVDIPVARSSKNILELASGGGAGSLSLDTQLAHALELSEVASRVVLGAELCTRSRSPARSLVRLLHGVMARPSLLICEPGFALGALLGIAAAQGSHVLAKAPPRAVIQPLARLPDASYMAMVAWEDGLHLRRHRCRVIDYQASVHWEPVRSRQRLLTTLADPERWPAEALIRAAYECDPMAAAAQGGPAPWGLGAYRYRGKTPALVRQELWAAAVVHYANCLLQPRNSPMSLAGASRKGEFRPLVREARGWSGPDKFTERPAVRA